MLRDMHNFLQVYTVRRMICLGLLTLYREIWTSLRCQYVGVRHGITTGVGRLWHLPLVTVRPSMTKFTAHASIVEITSVTLQITFLPT
jgi:hypothetical protein